MMDDSHFLLNQLVYKYIHLIYYMSSPEWLDQSHNVIVSTH